MSNVAPAQVPAVAHGHARRRIPARSVISNPKSPVMIGPSTNPPWLLAQATCNNATGQNSTQFAERPLDKQKVAVVPGIAFGDDKTIRISYATSVENIENGLKRIANFVTA